MTSLLKEQVIVHFGFNYLADKTWNILPGFFMCKIGSTSRLDRVKRLFDHPVNFRLGFGGLRQKGLECHVNMLAGQMRVQILRPY